jgi:hypothetical protein
MFNYCSVSSIVSDAEIMEILPRSVKDLINAPFPVFLTGSRWFDRGEVGSDYDFYMSRGSLDSLAREYLAESGFILLFSSYDEDDNINCLFESLTCHLQVINDMVLKGKVQNYLKKNFPQFYEYTKEQRREIWRLVQSIFQEHEHDL